MARSAIAWLLVALVCRCVLAAGRDALVGAYYYAWYNGSDFNGRPPPGSNTLVYHLEPRVKPELGWYNQREDPGVVSRHFKWAKYAGIDFFVCSYWGMGSATDRTIRARMLDNPDRGNTKLCVFWEPSMTQDDGVTGESIAAQTDYLCENYFEKPAYLKVDGRPVIFIYITRAMKLGPLAACVKAARAAAAGKGTEIYIVGDEVWGRPNVSVETPRMELLDAVTNYDIYGNLGRPRFVTDRILDEWQANNARWKKLADSLGKKMIPGISPGYNDRAVRGEEGHPACSRKLNDEKQEFGSFFKAMVDRLGEDAGMVMVTSWNEWHEDTQIEPTTVGDPTGADDRDGFYTEGLQYHGYGMLYLDILRRAYGASAGPLADLGMTVAHCAREALAIEQGSPLGPVLRALDRAAEKQDDRGREAAKFAEALRRWAAERSRELLKESQAAPARTLAPLKEHIKLVAGLAGPAGREELKAREKEIRGYKGITQLVSHYKSYDAIQEWIAAKGASAVTDQALAQLRKRLEEFARTKGLHESVLAETNALLGRL